MPFGSGPGVAPELAIFMFHKCLSPYRSHILMLLGTHHNKANHHYNNDTHTVHSYIANNT
jgi:hypothetical protein